MIVIDNVLVNEFKAIYNNELVDLIQQYPNIDDIITQKMKAGLGYIKLYLQTKLNWNENIDDEIKEYVKELVFRYAIAGVYEIVGKIDEARKIFDALDRILKTSIKEGRSFQSYIMDITSINW